MKITNPNLRPSERFIEGISEYFTLKGFTFKKKDKKFVKDFEKGKEIIFISFLTYSGTLVEVSPNWGLSFSKLEIVFAHLKGWTNKVDTGYTFGTTLSNLPMARDGKIKHQFPLYDEVTLKCDDFSINSAIKDFLQSCETYVEPFFAKYKEYTEIENQLNERPIKFSGLTTWTDKHIALGVILGFLLNPEKFDLIVHAYQDYLEQMYNKNELQDLLDKTLEYLKNIDKNSII